MTKLELEDLLEEIMPGCKIRKSRHGELIIYSNLTEDDYGEVASLNDLEEDIEFPETDDVFPLDDEDDCDEEE